MKRIYKAINEGLNKEIMSFDTDDDFKKVNPKNRNLKEFHFGDYVYKDPKLGYNNYIGEKVAICISDDLDHNLYASINRFGLENALGTKPYSKRETPSVYNGTCPEFGNGWENTLYIKNAYKDDKRLNQTIWAYLDDDEYVPNKEEMASIYSNLMQYKIDGLDFSKNHLYWTSTFDPKGETDDEYAGYAYYIYCNMDGDVRSRLVTKDCILHIMVLLKID